MIGRLVAALPILACALALGRATEAWSLVAVLVVVSAGLALAGERWELDRGRQVVTSAMGGGAGYAAATAMYEPTPGHLGEIWTRIAAGALLAAATRLILVRPAGGRAGMVAIMFAALLAIGQMRGGAVYDLAVIAFLLTSLWTLREGDPARGRLGALGARPLLVGAGVLAVAALVALVSVASLRRAHAFMMSRAQSTSFFWRPQVGFSDRMDLGALDGLLDSTTVVLRVRGPRVDYLRGAVFDVYEAGRWLRSEKLERETGEEWGGETPVGEIVEVEAVSERTDRFFLPLDARSVRTSPEAVLVDGLGTVKREGKVGAPVARFLRGPRELAVPSPPTTRDVGLSRRVRAAVQPLAEEWARDAMTTEAKLDAIESRLTLDYRYARSFRRATSVDPALDFLLRDKTGHCEYFATGMVLAARALDIPARVVTGFRVAERSPFGGYRVVRERNAHAWVEAFVEGKGWVTRDPTPEDRVPQNQPHDAGYFAAIIDIVRVSYDDLTTWLGRRTVTQTVLASLLGFFVLAIIIARGARKRGGAKAPVPDDEAPLPLLSTLLDSLARAGCERAPEESLEHLAGRAPDPRSASLLLRYAALRYGGLGDAGALASDVGAHVAARATPLS